MASILMVNLPYAGHTNPTLPLAGALVRRGHQVSYINAPEWRAKIEATGAHFIPYIEYPQNPTEQQKKTRCFLAAYKTVMQVGKGYDLLLYEMLFYPAKTIVARLGIPCVRQFSQPAWNAPTFAAVKKIAPLFKASCKLIDAQMMGRKTARAMDMQGASLISSVLQDAPLLNLVYVTEAFQPCRETFGPNYLFVGPPAIGGVAAAPPGTAAGGENGGKADVSAEGMAVGSHTPAGPATGKPGCDTTIEYAALRRPLVYISMGSIMSSRIFCKRCVKAFGGKSLSVILTTGRVAPDTLGPLPANIQALPFAPQMEILQHADLFITHGGMNSVNEAMYTGVPMLVLPVLNDQPINAEQVRRLGIGHCMRAFPTNAATLYKNTLAALADGDLRRNARAMGRQMQKESGAEGAATAIEAFLQAQRAQAL